MPLKEVNIIEGTEVHLQSKKVMKEKLKKEQLSDDYSPPRLLQKTKLVDEELDIILTKFIEHNAYFEFIDACKLYEGIKFDKVKSSRGMGLLHQAVDA